MNEMKPFFGKLVLALTLCAGAGVARAQFAYNDGIGQNGDLLVCFRPASGSYDLVVDCGSISVFTNLVVGQKITITNYYSPSQLKHTGTNNLYWSAMASARPPGNIWVTRPRASLNTQSVPWPCKNSSQQGSAASQIDSIGDDASNIASGGSPFGTSPANSNTYVVEPEGGSSSGGFYNSYSFQIGANGNLGGAFWGDSSGVSVEQSTPASFTTAGQPVRADFYQLLSASNGLPATYLGYFELSPSGVLTYTAGSSPTILTAPQIVSYVHKGTTNTISFTTVSGGTYTLRGTNSAGLATAVTNWPAIGSSLAGNGLTNSLVEVITNNSRLYTITAQ
jgi:hypothetical protein